MRKIKAFVTALLAAISLSSCGLPGLPQGEPTPPEPSSNVVHSYYTVADGETDLAAVFYLGTDNELEGAKAALQSKYFTSLPGKWPEGVESAESQPWEYYLLLPKYVGTVLTVSERDMQKYDKGEPYLNTILTTENPVLLKCNISDIFPSVEVAVEYGGEKTVCMPHISLKDGTVAAGDRIFAEDMVILTPTTNIEESE
jgi:hypothetical protein